MNWVFFASVSILSISIANIYQKILMKNEQSDPISYSILFQFVLASITGVFAIIRGFNPPPITQYPLNFLISALLYGLGTYASFLSLKSLEVSEVVIITTTGVIVSIVSSFIFLGEMLNVSQLVGAILILTAVALVSKQKNKFTIHKGIVFAFIGTSFYALAVTNDSFILKHYDAVSYTPIISFLPGIVLLLLKPTAVKNVIKSLTTNNVKNLFVFTFFYAIQSVTYYSALQNGAKVGQMASFSRISVIVTVLFALVFLKERDRIPQKIIASGLVMIGGLLVR